jgi:hypothetical protein
MSFLYGSEQAESLQITQNIQQLNTDPFMTKERVLHYLRLPFSQWRKQMKQSYNNAKRLV